MLSTLHARPLTQHSAHWITQWLLSQHVQELVQVLLQGHPLPHAPHPQAPEQQGVAPWHGQVGPEHDTAQQVCAWARATPLRVSARPAPSDVPAKRWKKLRREDFDPRLLVKNSTGSSISNHLTVTALGCASSSRSRVSTLLQTVPT
jgi:hypothetical protein